MSRIIKSRSKKRGVRPGTIVFIGEQKIEKPKIRVIDYNETELQEHEFQSIERCFPFKDTPTITWINIDGLHDVETIEKIGKHFNIHPLVLEDIANTDQRPKLETGDDYIFLVMKMLYNNDTSSRIITEQFSFIIGSNYLISFQERLGDVFEPVRDRLRKTNPRTRLINSDYLAYSLIDAIVDNCFVVLEDVAITIEDVEEALVKDPSTDYLETIHDLKHQLVIMRRSIWPLREVIGGLDRIESGLIKDATRPYLRDLYEHTIHVVETVETFREMVSGLLDIYLSSISNKMNEVMKVLTIIATIFIPLGFLAGVYGMNFERPGNPLNMPELGLPYGYILFWVIALLVGGGLFLYFKKKKWI